MPNKLVFTFQYWNIWLKHDNLAICMCQWTTGGWADKRKFGNRPVMPLMTRDKTGTIREKQGQVGTKHGQAGTKQGQQGQNRDSRDKQGQNRYNQGQNRDSRDKKGTAGTIQGQRGTVIARSRKTKVLDYCSLSLFSPCLSCPCFSLCWVTLSYPCFVYVLHLLALFPFYLCSFLETSRDSPFLSLSVSACSCLPPSVLVCPCLSPSVPVCPFLSLSVPICPSLSLSVPTTEETRL